MKVREGSLRHKLLSIKEGEWICLEDEVVREGATNMERQIQNLISKHEELKSRGLHTKRCDIVTQERTLIPSIMVYRDPVNGYF